MNGLGLLKGEHVRFMTYATLDRGQGSTEELPSADSGVIDCLVVENVGTSKC